MRNTGMIRLDGELQGERDRIQNWKKCTDYCIIDNLEFQVLVVHLMKIY